MQVHGFKRLLLAVALLLSAPLALAQFQAGMTLEAAEAQVQARLKSGATLDQIAQEAAAAKVDAGVVTIAMINAAGTDAAAVVQAMIKSGADVQAVVNAAVTAGATSESVSQGAAAAGVSPANIQLALAASPAASSGATGTGTGTQTSGSQSGSAGAGGGAGGGGGGGGTGSLGSDTASPS